MREIFVMTISLFFCFLDLLYRNVYYFIEMSIDNVRLVAVTVATVVAGAAILLVDDLGTIVLLDLRQL